MGKGRVHPEKEDKQVQRLTSGSHCKPTTSTNDTNYANIMIENDIDDTPPLIIPVTPAWRRFVAFSLLLDVIASLIGCTIVRDELQTQKIAHCDEIGAIPELCDLKRGYIPRQTQNDMLYASFLLSCFSFMFAVLWMNAHSMATTRIAVLHMRFLAAPFLVFKNLLVIDAVKVMSLAMDAINLAYPTDERLVLFSLIILTRLMFLLRRSEVLNEEEYDIVFNGDEARIPEVLMHNTWKREKKSSNFNVPEAEPDELIAEATSPVKRVRSLLTAVAAMKDKRKVVDDAGRGKSGLSSLAYLCTLDRFLKLKELRRNSVDKIRSMQKIFVLPFAFIFIVTLISFFGFYLQTIGQSEPFYNDEQLAKLMDHRNTVPYFGKSYTANTRVVLVVVDGLRWDHLTSNTRMRAFLNRTDMAQDSAVLRMKSSLPTMSVPNWVTIITGSPPEITGVLGNIWVPEIETDSLYSQAQNFQTPSYFMRGITGSPWFGDIIKSSLPTLEGYGVVPTDYGTSDDCSANLSDEKRSRTVNFAVQRVADAYKFFLAHFSDVDVQGHCYGVTTKYNTHNTYDAAVTNKTRLIESLMASLKLHPFWNNTVVAITADHGHINAGGHGGVDSVLSDVPFILYHPHSKLRTKQYKSHLRFATSNQTREENMIENPFQFQNQRLDNVMIAPTLAAIMGIPVPRVATGSFINAAMPLFLKNTPFPVTAPSSHPVYPDLNGTGSPVFLSGQMLTTGRSQALRDLFIQKQRLVRQFLVQIGYDPSHLKDMLTKEEVLGNNFNTNHTLTTASLANKIGIQEQIDLSYIHGTERLLVLYYEGRQWCMDHLTIRNFVLNIVTLILFCKWIYHIVTHYTVLPPWQTLFSNYWVTEEELVKKLQRKLNTIPEELKPLHQQPHHSPKCRASLMEEKEGSDDELSKDSEFLVSKEKEKEKQRAADEKQREFLNQKQKELEEARKKAQEQKAMRSKGILKSIVHLGVQKKKTVKDEKIEQVDVIIEKVSTQSHQLERQQHFKKVLSLRDLNDDENAPGPPPLPPSSSFPALSGQDNSFPSSFSSSKEPVQSNSYVTVIPSTTKPLSSSTAEEEAAQWALFHSAVGEPAVTVLPLPENMMTEDVVTNDGVNQTSLPLIKGATAVSVASPRLESGTTTARSPPAMKKEVSFSNRTTDTAGVSLPLIFSHPHHQAKDTGKPGGWGSFPPVRHMQSMEMSEEAVSDQITDDEEQVAHSQQWYKMQQRIAEDEKDISASEQFEGMTLWSRAWKQVENINEKALLHAILFVLLYIVVSILSFIISAYVMGYSFDSTIIHHPGMLVKYLSMALVPGIIMQIIILRAYVFSFIRRPVSIYLEDDEDDEFYGTTLRESSQKNFPEKNDELKKAPKKKKKWMNPMWYLQLIARYVVVESTIMRGKVNKHGFGYVYAFRVYLCLFTALFALMLMVFQSFYGIMIPFVYQLNFLDGDTWVMRFRILTLQLISLPLLFGVMIHTFVWPPFDGNSRDELEINNQLVYDELCVMRILHAKHHHLMCESIGVSSSYITPQRELAVQLTLICDETINGVQNEQGIYKKKQLHQKLQKLRMKKNDKLTKTHGLNSLPPFEEE